MFYQYDQEKEICTVIYNGNTLKMNLSKEQTLEIAKLVVDPNLSEEEKYENIKNFYLSLNTNKSLFQEEIIRDNTLREMIDEGFFEMFEGNIFYRLGLKLSLPNDLVNCYIDAYSKKDAAEIEKLDKFWHRMYLCPVDHARQDAFSFLSRGGFKIADNGLILAGRNVETKNEFANITPEIVQDLVDKVKNSWKQKLSNVEVYHVDGEYILFDTSNKNKPNGIYLGNLEEIQNKATEEVFTDNYTKSTEIRFNVPVSQTRKSCDHNRLNTCSKGLHFASIDHFSQSSYSGNFGSTSILVAIDPMDLVAIPPIDHYWKGRCCRYLPICKVDRDENGNIVIPDMSQYKEMLENYSKYTLFDLQQKTVGHTATEVDINYVKVLPDVISTNDLYESLLQYALSDEQGFVDQPSYGEDDVEIFEDENYDEEYSFTF